MRQSTKSFFPVAALSALLLVSLHLMSGATQNSAEFSRLYSWLLAINALGLVALVIMIGLNVLRLFRQYRNRATGSRLTLRLVILFVTLALIPVLVVYYFSLQFLNRGIDSWFDVRIEKALDSSLELSRTSLNAYMRGLLRDTSEMSAELMDTPNEQLANTLNKLRVASNATELTLMTYSGHILATSSANPIAFFPNRPDEALLLQLRQQQSYATMDSLPDGGLHIRTLVEIPGTVPTAEAKIIQALFPISGRMSELTADVQSAYAQYEELSYMRRPLKFSFTLTLSMVLLLSVLTAVWAAFFSARQLVAPIRVLAIGTRAVAGGDYTRRLPQPSNDELGFLVQSFNEMTRRIAVSREEAKQSHQHAEAQRTYLEAVLAHLSSGVMTFDRKKRVQTTNAAAARILGINTAEYVGRELTAVAEDHHQLSDFSDSVTSHLTIEQPWQQEITLFTTSGRRILMCRGTPLPTGVPGEAGQVLVFDDITALVQAQRDAAWGEVARRLAHEIKNPLTPIQLSAERLRHKYLKTMPPENAEVLDRLTHTIIQQVETMEEMVNAFSDYARPPHLRLERADINMLINEVLDLYRGTGEQLTIRTDLDSELPVINVDGGRIRQLLHNLVKNAIESAEVGQNQRIAVKTRQLQIDGARAIEIEVNDSGSGIPADISDRIFEPYVTTKAKGSGLGLAIAKKIVEEHSGTLWAQNLPTGGTSVTVQLPLDPAERSRERRPA